MRMPPRGGLGLAAPSADSASRRDRPVRVRNTSSSVGRCTSMESSETPPASRSRSRPGTDAPGALRPDRGPGGRTRPRHRRWPAAARPRARPGRRRRPRGRPGRPTTCALRLSLVSRGDDPALVDDHDPVAEGVGLVEVVGGEEHRRPALGAQPGDVVPEVGPRLRVQAGRRLVEEHQRRVVDQAHHDVEPALLAARHVLGHPLPQALELELVEQLLAAASARRPGDRP